jgi:hypothetical protein
MTETWGNEKMTRREAFIVVGFLLFPIFAIGCLTIAALILVLIPREYTRRLRRALGSIVMRQWEVGSNLSSIAYGWLWQKGNGH